MLACARKVRNGAWAAGLMSGWERPQWCSKATSPGPRGGDADAPKTVVQASDALLDSAAIGCLRLEFGSTGDGDSGPVRGNMAEWSIEGLAVGLLYVNLVVSAPFSQHAGSPRSSLRRGAS